MSYSLGNNAPVEALLFDAEIQSVLSFEADIVQMLAFEVELAKAQAGVGLISDAAAAKISEAIACFSPDMDALQSRFAIDGVAVPTLVSQVRSKLDDTTKGHFHLGATSQDLVDTSAMIRLKKAVEICTTRLKKLDNILSEISSGQIGNGRLHARTRMQNALPISVSEKIENWRAPLERLLKERPQYFPLQLGGPEGAARAFGDQHAKVSSAMAAALEINAPARQWHTDRHPIVAIGQWFTSVATALGKTAQDILIMVQNDVAEAKLAGGGSSSAMPHKTNPVLAEIIVAQARYCQAQMAGLNTASLHENERSGTAWTLEWMLLPQLVATASGSVTKTTELVNALKFSPSTD